jgi:hypothetical protein
MKPRSKITEKSTALQCCRDLPTGRVTAQHDAVRISPVVGDVLPHPANRSIRVVHHVLHAKADGFAVVDVHDDHAAERLARAVFGERRLVS